MLSFDIAVVAVGIGPLQTLDDGKRKRLVTIENKKEMCSGMLCTLTLMGAHATLPSWVDTDAVNELNPLVAIVRKLELTDIKHRCHLTVRDGPCSVTWSNPHACSFAARKKLDLLPVPSCARAASFVRPIESTEVKKRSTTDAGETGGGGAAKRSCQAVEAEA